MTDVGDLPAFVFAEINVNEYNINRGHCVKFDVDSFSRFVFDGHNTTTVQRPTRTNE